MVELRLESFEELNLPKDVFVSVRIGEAQKLSRLSANRVYKFPKAGDRRFGKIEVFRRIGACSVDVDPTNKDLRDLSISCNEAGFGALNLKMAVAGEEPVQKDKEDSGDVKKEGGKVKAAKEYLSRHGLEVRLSEAMQAVLRERPENPAEFLAARLLATPKDAVGGLKLPPAVPKPAKKEAEAAPTKSIMPVSTAKPQPPEASFQSLNPEQAAAKVEPPRIVTMTRMPTHLKPSVGTWLQAIPKPVNTAVVAAKTPSATFKLKPSVGTWLAPCRPALKPKTEDLSFEAMRVGARKSLIQASLDGSLAAELAKMSKQMAEKDLSFEAMRVGTQKSLTQASLDGSLAAVLAKMSKQMAEEEKKAATAVTATPGWVHKPSVGTWLAKPGRALRPSVAAKPAFNMSPSVGTWLVPRLKTPEQTALPARAQPLPERQATGSPSVPAYSLPPDEETPMLMSMQLRCGPSFASLGMSAGLMLI